MVNVNGSGLLLTQRKQASVHLSQPLLAGRYHLGKRLTHSNLTVVYQGKDLYNHRSVAIKCYDQTQRVTAQREGNWLGHLSGAGLISGDGSISWKQKHWLVMPLISGQPLGWLLQAKRTATWCVYRRQELIKQLIDSINALHQQGLEHGDIKPNNILVDQATGHTTLIDYSCTLKIGQQRPACYGSPPWQAAKECKIIDGSRDWYGLGLIIWSLWTGHYPLNSNKCRFIGHWGWGAKKWCSGLWLKKQLIKPTKLNGETIKQHFG